MEIGLLMRYDKVYGFFHEDDETKPVVLLYSGERTIDFSSFSYLVDGAKGGRTTLQVPSKQYSAKPFQRWLDQSRINHSS